MAYNRSLRFRLIFSYYVLSAVIGSILLLFLFTSLESIESSLVTEHVSDELQYFKTLTEENPNTTSMQTKVLRGYKLEKGQHLDQYPFLTSLDVGLHEIKFENKEFVIGVAESNSKHMIYMFYDITHYEKQEHLLIKIFVIITLCAVIAIAWYGYTVSSRLISPVTNLAHQVEQLTVNNQQQRITNHYANDEVGELAAAFNDHLDTINQFFEREKNFTADASHELRTPLSVIQNAVELILAQDNLDEKIQKPLSRIERAASEMLQNLTALLHLARELPMDNNGEAFSDIMSITQNILDTLPPDLQHESVKVELEQHAEPKLMIPVALVTVLLSNLIRNAFTYCEKGKITISIHENKVIIEDTGIGISAEDLAHVHERGYHASNSKHKGIGIGLSIVNRICDRFNCQIDIQSKLGQGTRVSWIFKTIAG